MITCEPKLLTKRIMDLEEVIPELKAIPEENRPKLQEYLNDFPDNMEKWFYSKPSADTILQGDLYENIPFLHLKPSICSPFDFLDNHECFPSQVMVLSNTCDIKHKKSRYVTVSPLAAIQGLVDNIKDENYLVSLKKNLKTDIMYIPSSPNGLLGESMVYLYRAMSIPIEYFGSKDVKKISSLSQYGYYFFLIKLAWHFLRPSRDDS